jgi:hypothetical protein
MTDDHNPRAELGGNDPPTDLELLQARLERDYEPLAAEAAAIEVRAFTLPEKPATEAECATLIEFVAAAKAVVKKAEGDHTTEKKPHWDAGKAVDVFFKSLWTPLETRITANEARISAFMRAKAEAQRQERLAAQREQDRLAQVARDEAARLEKVARDAEEEAERKAAALRKAATPEQRQEIAAELNEAEQDASAARHGAQEATKEATQAERVGESHGRAAGGSVGRLGKVTTSGAGASHSTFWNHRVVDEEALKASLGPLGPYLADDAINSAIGAAKREAVAAKTIEALAVPGCEFFEDSRATVRQAR